MRLSDSEAKRFYGIWFALLHYVNQQRKLVPTFPQVWTENNRVTAEVALKVRDALWADDALREKFIAENPAKLSRDDLALVASWQHRVAGSFFIVRYLKKHSVFISDTPQRGYGVLGLLSTIEEIAGPHLPIYVQAVLLPFEDRIVVDGLLAPYSIMFGPGYRASLRELYNRLYERGEIITQLPPGSLDDARRVEESNKKVLRQFEKALRKSGLSQKMVTEHSANLSAFATDYLNQQMPPRMLLDIQPQDIEQYASLQGESFNVTSFKRFAWFMRDSGRIDWEAAENLLAYLNKKKK